ncbi:hypothetical protein M8818_003914 [Zalaria obscura]|uniref:Uncharacterized protein n=1 Tax=Zalaria obscura TaxID=2024903 RepID=A0ACC3SDI7_9PEZI
MPKKHNRDLTKHYSTTSTPNRVSQSTDPSSSSAPSLTVNERLQHLRLAQASPKSLERKLELAEASSSKSVPPSLGAVLGVAPTAPPKPKAGVRPRVRLRTPGPAPPPSWLAGRTDVGQLETGMRRAPRKVRTFGAKGELTRTVPQLLCRFLKLVGEQTVPEGSLLHSALRATAENWDLLGEDAADCLGPVPLHLRLVLLSYLTKYGPQDGIDIGGLGALLHGHDDVDHLDLSGLAGWGFTLKELHRFLSPYFKRKAPPTAPTPPLTPTLADSWDEEDTPHSPTTPLPPSLQLRLPTLTKLSLSHPTPTISWPDLLTLSKSLHTLTHLSLAHWPLPTRTPRTTSTLTPDPNLPASTTSPLRAPLRDYTEAAVVLRLLSHETYCLRFLDLEGCADWIPALACLSSSPSTTTALASPSTSNPTSNPNPTFTSTSASSLAGSSAAFSNVERDWLTQHTLSGPSWTGAWRHLTRLRLAQPWAPCDVDAIATVLRPAWLRNLPAARMADLLAVGRERLEWVRERKGEEGGVGIGGMGMGIGVRHHCAPCHGDGCGEGDCDPQCRVCEIVRETEAKMTLRWLEREAEAVEVGRRIRRDRKGVGGAGLGTFDFGWRVL